MMSKDKKILFIGSVLFSKEILEYMLKKGFNITAVISKKRKKSISDYYDLKKIRFKKNINFKYSNDINDNKTFQFIKKINPDYVFCLGWSQILKPRTINLANICTIGYHPSDLPNNRGKHPIIWSLVNGLKKTASTFFIINKGIDAGKIISKTKVNIKETDHAKDLYFKLLSEAKKQITNIFKDLRKVKKQKRGNKKGNYWRKRNYEDGKIDWRMSSKSIYDLVRALSYPYIGAHFIKDAKEIKVFKVKIVKHKSCLDEPGKIISINKGLPIIKCGSNAIKIEKYYPKSKFKLNRYL
jgi:methionyl-tRNA formyltransferase